MADTSHRDHLMYNGATVGDWLGTIRMNANVAAKRLDGLRTSGRTFRMNMLIETHNELKQATKELEKLIDHELKR